MKITLSNGQVIPVEMHKVRIVQKINLKPAARRLHAMEEAGYNTFLLRTRDIFLDMLTDSGTNAMSDNQLAAMMVADDAYAGSESFYRLADTVREVLGFNYTIPVHQGRAAEHLLAKTFVKPGDVVLMNYHFTTTKAHFELAGAEGAGALHRRGHGYAKHPSFPRRHGSKKTQADHSAVTARARSPLSAWRRAPTSLGASPSPWAICARSRRLPLPLGFQSCSTAVSISENAYFIKERDQPAPG